MQEPLYDSIAASPLDSSLVENLHFDYAYEALETWPRIASARQGIMCLIMRLWCRVSARSFCFCILESMFNNNAHGGWPALADLQQQRLGCNS